MSGGGLLLGLDLGTTVLKVCAVDAENGTLRAHRSERLSVRTVPGGGREQDLRSLEQALRNAVASLRVDLGSAWREVRGVALAAQGGSSAIVTRDAAEPQTPLYLWNDARAQEHTARLAEQAPVERWRSHALYEVPPHGLGRLAWLKERFPDGFTPENLHAGAGEYIFFRLTGTWRQDPGNAIQIGSYNAVRCELDDDLFRLIDVPLSFVAPLRQGHPTSPLGPAGARLLDLSEGTPVAGPYIDQEAGFLSAVGLSPRPLQVSLGTAWVGNFVLPDDTAGSAPFQLVLPAPAGDGRLVVQPLLTGNVAWDWGLEQLLGDAAPGVFERAEAVFRAALLPPEGLTALPWFAQPNPVDATLVGGGAFVGLNPAADRADLLRALALSLTFELARVFEDVLRSRAVDSVVLTGGASRGSFFRIFIAALTSPLEVFAQDEDVSAPARGALYALAPPAARLRTVRVPPPPDETAAEIRRRYGTYRRTFERLFGEVRAGCAFRLTGEGP